MLLSPLIASKYLFNYLIGFMVSNSLSVHLTRDCKSFVAKSAPIPSDNECKSGVVIVIIRNFPFNLSLIETTAVVRNLKELSLEEQTTITIKPFLLLQVLS